MQSHILQIMLIRIIAFILFANQIQGQEFVSTSVANLPFKTSNNAVCSGVLNDTDYVFSFGGIDSSLQYSGIHLRSARYNTFTGVVQEIAPLPDTLGKIAPAASCIGDVIYIVGGYHVFSDGHELSSNKVHRYQISTNSYLPDAANIPVAIDDHVQDVWRDSLLFIITGWSNTTNVPNVQVYNPTNNTWNTATPVPNNNIYKSFGASGVIIEDTIYYFGGARFGFNFSLQKNLRKGIINPENPLEINWSDTLLDIGLYRAACADFLGHPTWFGGSELTYNFNGLSYASNSGVEPSETVACFNADSLKLYNNNFSLMDLRGIAKTSSTTFYTMGGMLENQQATNQVFKHEFEFALSNNLQAKKQALQVFPNPTKEGIINLLSTNNKEGYIYSLDGQLVKKVLVKNNQIDLGAITKGIYILKLGRSTQKIGVQ